MNTKRFFLSVIVVFGFVFLYEGFVHGHLLMEAYQATAGLWRPMGDHMDFMKFMMLGQLAQAFMITYIFTRHYEARGVKEGLRFGLYIGLLLASIDLAAYSYLPVEFSLVASWMGASLLKGVGAGAVLALVYKA
jgi:hypothetical protein